MAFWREQCKQSSLIILGTTQRDYSRKNSITIIPCKLNSISFSQNFQKEEKGAACTNFVLFCKPKT